MPIDGQLRRFFAIALAVLLAGGVFASSANAEPDAAGCPAVDGDWAGSGPFAVATEAGGPAHTIYRPTDLGSRGCATHPVVIWGNGTGATPKEYDALLRHLASHGFVVAAANTTQAASGRQMLAGIDYLAARNAAPSSPYHGRLDLDRVGAAGHSQGGGGTIAAGADPRVDTTVPLQPGPFGKVTALRGPALFLAGSLDLIVPPATLVYPRYQQVRHVPAAYGELAAGTHFTPVGDGGGYRGPVTAWLRWRLMDDEQARGAFSGPDCTYCAGPDWTRFENNGV